MISYDSTMILINFNSVYMEIIKFSAQWCGPCKVYQSEWNKAKEANQDSNVVFKEVDIDLDEDNLVERYNIKSVPTTIMVDKDNLLYRFTGVKKSTELTQDIWKVLDKVD